MSCMAGKMLGRKVPRKHKRIELAIMWKGKRLEICKSCWIKISRSDV